MKGVSEGFRADTAKGLLGSLSCDSLCVCTHVLLTVVRPLALLINIKSISSLSIMQATVEELRAAEEGERSRAAAAEAHARQLQADAARTAAKHAGQLKQHQQVCAHVGQSAGHVKVESAHLPPWPEA